MTQAKRHHPTLTAPPARLTPRARLRALWCALRWPRATLQAVANYQRLQTRIRDYARHRNLDPREFEVLHIIDIQPKGTRHEQ